jgi:hypothetical protein
MNVEQHVILVMFLLAVWRIVHMELIKKEKRVVDIVYIVSRKIQFLDEYK